MRKFWKLHGAGNDFVLLDCRASRFDLDAAQRALLCDRHFGVGCDQLIAVFATDAPTRFALKFYNQDGGETGACGNGTRCAASWLMQRTDLFSMTIQVGARELMVDSVDGSVWVDMGAADFAPENVPMQNATESDLHEALGIDRKICTHIDACSMGNPHLVLMLSAPATDALIQEWGARLERHVTFPERANIGFAYLDDMGMQLRVWERGVGETYACGSGACAALAVALRAGLWQANTLKIQMRGGLLALRAAGADIHMTGPVACVAEGTWYG